MCTNASAGVRAGSAASTPYWARDRHPVVF
jgi:hypothetical protein